MNVFEAVKQSVTTRQAAEHFGIRKRESAVDDKHIVCALDHGHILADLTETAERDDADRRFCTGLTLLLRRRFLYIGMPRLSLLPALCTDFFCCSGSSLCLFTFLLFELFADKLRRQDLSADCGQRDAAALLAADETALGAGTACVSVQ